MRYLATKRNYLPGRMHKMNRLRRKDHIIVKAGGAGEATVSEETPASEDDPRLDFSVAGNSQYIPEI